MAPVWPALIGAIAALASVWVTQALTNRREVQRDQLKWAQERQQRELDVQKAAFVEARIALNDWHRALRTAVLWVSFPLEPKPNVVAFSDHLSRANSGLTTVELVCSESAIKATYDAVAALTMLHHTTTAAARETEMNRSATLDWCTSTPPDTTQTREAMVRLLSVYRVELAKLSTEPVVLTKIPRKRFRLSWRRSTQQSL